MDIKEAIQELKPRLEEYLQEKGIRKKQFKCLNPNHNDKHPSMSFYKQADIVHCFACGETYDIIDLLSMDLGFGPKPKKQDFLEVIKYGCQQYGIPFEEIPSRKDYIEKCHKEVAKTDYFQKRGISSKTIKKYRLGYDENFSINKTIKIKAVIIPCQKGFVARNIDPESKIRFSSNEGIRGIFNEKAFKNNLPIIITEGEIDALSVIECGLQGVSLGGSGNAEKIVDLCKKYNYQSTLLLALDNDEAGEKATKRLEEELAKNHIKYKTILPYGESKDANEALLKDKTSLQINLGKEVRKAIEEENIEKENQEIIKKLNLLDKKERNEIIERINNFLNKNEGKIQTSMVGIPKDQQ